MPSPPYFCLVFFHRFEYSKILMWIQKAEGRKVKKSVNGRWIWKPDPTKLSNFSSSFSLLHHAIKFSLKETGSTLQAMIVLFAPLLLKKDFLESVLLFSSKLIQLICLNYQLADKFLVIFIFLIGLIVDFNDFGKKILT